jgi:hypothetical protein
LSVQGNAIVDEAGRPVTLHGVNLPSLREMAEAGIDPMARLQTAAAAGAAVVRLAVYDEEVVPNYVYAKLMPVIRRANELDLLVILSWRNNTRKRLNQQADDSDGFLRLAVPALRGYNGVWFDPFDQPLETTPAKQRAVALRMVDVVRGLGDDRIVVVNNASWMQSTDPELNSVLQARNVVYGVMTLSGWETARAPFFMTMPADEAALSAARAVGVGSVMDERSADQTLPKSTRCPGP